jgi:putative ABC transport system permease protein
MAAIEQQLEREYPGDTSGWSVRVERLSDAIIGHTTPLMLYLLLAAVGALLLVACTNLSGLLLVRAHARTREIAIRTAIGGGRGRIVRQLITESLLLAAIGGLCGIALSYAGVSILRTVAMADVPRAEHIRVDGSVLVFALAVSALAGVLAGLAPARQATTLDVHRGIKEGAGSVMRGGSLTRNVLIVAQLAVSIALLASAGLAVRALTRLSTVDLGFKPHQIVTLQVAPRSNPETFVRTLLDRLRTRANVAAVAATSGAPMSFGNTSLHVFPVGPAAIGPTESVQSDWRVISDGYFNAMETPLIAGRDFTPHDDGRAQKVIVVNQTLAKTIWGDANPVGKQVDLGGGGGQPATVIGLVRDARSHTPSELPSPTYYMSAYRGIYGPMTIVVRTTSPVDALLPAIRADIRALDPALPVFTVKTMDDMVKARLAPQRLVAALLVGFALMALLLAVVGIYGAMAYATGQRTRDVALRLALGATRWDVIRPLLREGAGLVLAGVVLGLVVAVPLTRMMRALLADVSPNDPLTFAAAIAVLGVTTMLACYLPARRASRVNAVEALRGE